MKKLPLVTLLPALALFAGFTDADSLATEAMSQTLYSANFVSDNGTTRLVTSDKLVDGAFIEFDESRKFGSALPETSLVRSLEANGPLANAVNFNGADFYKDFLSQRVIKADNLNYVWPASGVDLSISHVNAVPQDRSIKVFAVNVGNLEAGSGMIDSNAVFSDAAEFYIETIAVNAEIPLSSELNEALQYKVLMNEVGLQELQNAIIWPAAVAQR